MKYRLYGIRGEAHYLLQLLLCIVAAIDKGCIALVNMRLSRMYPRSCLTKQLVIVTCLNKIPRTHFISKVRAKAPFWSSIDNIVLPLIQSIVAKSFRGVLLSLTPIISRASQTRHLNI
jgi:hypothetical protein